MESAVKRRVLTIPLIGFVASLFLPLFAALSRSLLWPLTSPIMRHLAVTGLWLPALLAVVSFGRLGLAATTWLLIPLCVAVGAALVVPAVLAVAAYLIGTTVGGILRTLLVMVTGEWAAPLAYAAASRWLVDSRCVA
ncbi:hypothetical protein LCL61_29345 [Amycolatopsis coloradensis]|uniref:Uncharacterized protein n=1 Tax=Amycolatopsis coloradensis TaxID=76021 RepID=A0ACD5BK92_9PSEU